MKLLIFRKSAVSLIELEVIHLPITGIKQRGFCTGSQCHAEENPKHGGLDKYLIGHDDGFKFKLQATVTRTYVPEQPFPNTGPDGFRPVHWIGNLVLGDARDRALLGAVVRS